MADTKKYEFTDDTITLPGGNKARRIKALVDIGERTKAGDLGGYIEHEGNLSHKNNAWVDGDARVYGQAKIYGDAWVYNNAWVYGHAKVYGTACVSGNAKVYDNAWVYRSACIAGNACVSGDTDVYGKTTDYCGVSPIRNRNDSVTLYRTETGIAIKSNCFCGTLDEFAKAVSKTHSADGLGNIYRLLIEAAKLNRAEKKRTCIVTKTRLLYQSPLRKQIYQTGLTKQKQPT
jgi:uncharacterized Fe-S cluster protein YjdI